MTAILFFETLHLLPQLGLFPHMLANRIDGKPPTEPLRFFSDDWQKAVVPTVAYLGSARRDTAEIARRCGRDRAEMTRIPRALARRTHGRPTILLLEQITIYHALGLNAMWGPPPTEAWVAPTYIRLVTEASASHIGVKPRAPNRPDM